jgi:hypothetical protein
MPRLRRSDCSGPGIIRMRHGRGFSYRDPDGERIKDEPLLERIRGTNGVTGPSSTACSASPAASRGCGGA